MIVNIEIIRGNDLYFKEPIMLKVREFQSKGYRVEIQYVGDYEALVIARDCDWVGNNS